MKGIIVRVDIPAMLAPPSLLILNPTNLRIYKYKQHERYKTLGGRGGNTKPKEN